LGAAKIRRRRKKYDITLSTRRRRLDIGEEENTNECKNEDARIRRCILGWIYRNKYKDIVEGGWNQFKEH